MCIIESNNIPYHIISYRIISYHILSYQKFKRYDNKVLIEDITKDHWGDMCVDNKEEVKFVVPVAIEQ